MPKLELRPLNATEQALVARVREYLNGATPGQPVKMPAELLQAMDDAARAAAMPEILARRRMEWLHSAASNNVNGYEWGIYRVKWENGQPAEVWQTNADFSDLDAAISDGERGMTLLAATKRLYSQHTANHPTIHCNRFPSWDEMPKDEQNKWLRAAMADAASSTDARGVNSSTKEQPMSRYWISWWHPGKDPRPLHYPPKDRRVLGWWESGYKEGSISVCALVLADDEKAARDAVYIDWPESHEAEWRFADAQEADYLPGDRFPLSHWMRQRIDALGVLPSSQRSTGISTHRKVTMRLLNEHQVNPANDTLIIEVVDDPGHGGACHSYKVSGGNFEPVEIDFQNGPINEVGVNGLTHEALLAIVADRLRGFQSGPFACKANACALTHIEEAQHWLQQRTLERMRRGVEGTHKL